MTLTAGRKNNVIRYGIPTAPSKLDLMGLRFFNGDGDGTGAGGDESSEEQENSNTENENDESQNDESENEDDKSKDEDKEDDDKSKTEKVEDAEKADETDDDEEEKAWVAPKDFTPEQYTKKVNDILKDKRRLSAVNAGLVKENEDLKSEKTERDRKKILEDFGLPETHLRFITGDDEKAWTEAAELLAGGKPDEIRKDAAGGPIRKTGKTAEDELVKKEANKVRRRF